MLRRYEVLAAPRPKLKLYGVRRELVSEDMVVDRKERQGWGMHSMPTAPRLKYIAAKHGMLLMLVDD